jgi:DNA-directed RNA polymerase subunit RPC12/RpoP
MVPIPVAELAEKSRTLSKGFRCPFCGTRELPVVHNKMAISGWIYTFGMCLIPGCGWMLAFLGMLMRDEWKECNECGTKIGGDAFMIRKPDWLERVTG